jgi:hypothetical protein
MYADFKELELAFKVMTVTEDIVRIIFTWHGYYRAKIISDPCIHYTIYPAPGVERSTP